MNQHILVIWKNLAVGGIVAGWRNRAAVLAKEGIQTEFLFFRDLGGAALLRNVAPYKVTEDAREAAAWIRGKDYQCVVVIDQQAAFPILEEAGYKGPVVIESRVSSPEFVRRETGNASAFRSARFVVASHFQKSILLEAMSGSSVRVRVIPNTVDTDLFKPVQEQERLDLLQNLHADGKKIVAWIGRISKEKNWNMFLEIAKEMLERRNDVFFWMIGGGVSESQKRLLRRKLERWNPGKRFVWHQEMFDYRQMPHVYAAIAGSGGTLVSTSLQESFGNVFIEAMACGCPVIAPCHSAIQEIIEHNVNGKLYKPGSVRNALRQLDYLLDRPRLRDRIIRNGLDDVREKYGNEGMYTRKYVALVKRMIRRHSASERVQA